MKKPLLNPRTTPARYGALLILLVLAGGFTGAVAADAQAPGVQQPLRVYGFTLKYQRTEDAVALIRPLLSSRGTVEEQPGSNTLVLRDTHAALAELIPVLQAFDRPPKNLRLQIHLVRAGAAGEAGASVAQAELAPEMVERLRGLLRYDDYRVLAEAGLSSKEGEEIVYSLGDSYKVSFRLGRVLHGERVKLEGFKITRQLQNPTNKGRQLKPRDLFHASLNLRLDRLFTLVLAEAPTSLEAAREDALMVAITCRWEDDPEPVR